MMSYAHLDLMATELGMLYMGGSLAFYDQTREEQVESMAVALVRVGGDCSELSIAPATSNAIVAIWNDIHAPAAGSGPPSTADALMAKMERG